MFLSAYVVEYFTGIHLVAFDTAILFASPANFKMMFMNYKLVITLSALYLLSSCTSQENKDEKPGGSSGEIKNETSVTNCYQYAGMADTITLTLARTGETFTGTLVYHLKEKDSNTGTILGSKKGDILLADYTFMSEGVQSVRQVAFKQEGNTLVEGYGDIETRDDKVYFKDTDSLQFNSSMKLVEKPCQ
jgi:hypothetical protein